MFHCEKNIAFSLKKAEGVGDGGVGKGDGVQGGEGG